MFHFVLWDADFEDVVVERGGDGFGVGFFGEDDGAGKIAPETFAGVVVFFGDFFFGWAFTFYY